MENLKEKILKWIDDHEDELIQISKEVIAIPTVSANPDAQYQYSVVDGYWAKKFDEIGLTDHAEYQNGEKAGANFMCTMKGVGGGKNVAMGGHSDVVPAEETEWVTGSGFNAQIIDGKLYGRGAADMKCGLAASYIAMKALVENGVKLKGDLSFVSSIDEEVGGPNGMVYLVKCGALKPDFFINAEQTNMNVITDYMGTCFMEVTVTGKTAHGGMPYLGVNAIEKACKIIQELTTIGLEWEEDPRLGKSTICIGKINGGVARNVVPETCTFTIDNRMVGGQTEEKVMAEINALLKKMMRNDPTFKAELRHTGGDKSPTSFSTSDPLVKSLIENGKAIGWEPKLGTNISPGDCRHLHRIGATALMCGPGGLGDIHKCNEFALVSEIVAAAKVYALTSMDLCEVAD